MGENSKITSKSYLSLYIQNAELEPVKTWLDENAASFGFFKEYDSERHYFLYVKAREEIPARVLEIEKLPPVELNR